MTAVLKITNGTDWVSLIKTEDSHGFHLEDWTPQSAEYKGGGEYQDSPAAHGKRLVVAKYDNVIETFSLKANGANTDLLIAETQRLRQLLRQAADYWTSDSCGDPVWIECKAHLETNTRYAIIHQGRLVTDDNPFGSPFLQPTCKAVMDELELVVERGHWTALPPGEGECVNIAGQQNWVPGTWTSVSSAPVGAFGASIVLSNGIILFAGVNELWRITAESTFVAAGTPPTGAVFGLAETSNGYVFAAAADGIWRSTDSGHTWSKLTAAREGNSSHCLICAQDNSLWLADNAAGAYRSTDGTSWTQYNTGLIGTVATTIIQLSNGAFVLAADSTIYYSTSPTTIGWLKTKFVISAVTVLYEADGYVYAGYGTTLYRASIDDLNTSWGPIVTGFTEIKDFATDGTNHYAVSGQTTMGISRDMLTWQIDTVAGPAGDGLQVVEFSWGRVFLGEVSDIYANTEELTLGNESNDCDNSVLVANKGNKAQLTNIQIDDGGVYTEKFPATSFPHLLLPAVPVDNDAVYFGVQSGLAAGGPFDSLVFDISTPITYSAAPTLTWQYYSTAGGGTWVALTVQDNTAGFTKTGINSVHWTPDATWTTVAVNSITAYWVRLFVTSDGTGLTGPYQGNRNVYTVPWSSIRVDEADIKGDIPSHICLQLTNVSDKDGPAGNAPDLYDNKIICGLRSESRGLSFNAYLNASDEQNPTGLVCAAAVATTTFADSIVAPTGRRAVYNPTAAVTTMTTQLTWTISTSVARDYYGVYHAFLRYQQSGTAGDITFRLKITTGTGGISTYGETKTPPTTNDFQIMDMGRITLPVSNLIRQSEIPDSTVIALQCTAASGTPNLYVYDLILIPTDEWAGEFVDTVNTADSAVEQGKMLEIDSLKDPKQTIIAKVKTSDANEFISSIWQTNANGPAILQANSSQRLWFLCARTSAAASTEWVSYPNTVHAVKVYKNEQYLGMRGSN